MLFTNGCFDVLHEGHIRLLSFAYSLDPHIIVGLNSDASVRRLKGPTRPHLTQNNRRSVLAALRQVSDVIIFDEDTPIKLITALRPDILLKGYESAPPAPPPVGASYVESYGGRVVIAPRFSDFHSSDLFFSKKTS